MAATSAYHPPPPYYKLHKDDLVDLVSAPQPPPPPPPVQGTYTVYGATYTVIIFPILIFFVFLFCLLRTCFDVCGDCLFDGRLMTYFQLWRIKGSVSSAPKTRYWLVLGTLSFSFSLFFYTVFFFNVCIFLSSNYSKWFLCIKLYRINGSDEFCMTMTSLVVFPKCSGDVVVCFYVAKVRDN